MAALRCLHIKDEEICAAILVHIRWFASGCDHSGTPVDAGRADAIRWNARAQQC
ncbi:hypothetical protein B0T18DRAFT_239342 [Schizothecium vesticola]|uniref:Uncharacterized protein n=1 Tax=Schizothecium vesticola TaxID=314040 RepID=A0AA40EHF3_9PEZI|nr:hypothetical protein B0T18DRAFT_239342 [Schizothecium vesticola]